MHNIFCIVGRTSVGKSTITRLAAKKLNMKVLQSYTTREMRKNEKSMNLEDLDHIFVSKDEAKKYQTDMVAYTCINDNEYWCNKSQLYENDFYVIDPNGIKFLKDYITHNNINDLGLIVININMPYFNALSYAVNHRGQSKSDFETRYKSETKQFTDFEKENNIDYHLLNDSTLDEAVEKLIKIVSKYNR